jgi:hypothetical protein
MMVKLDLGCGSTKPDGFVGIDRYALPGVDIVADLDQSLPFRDHSIDFVLSSHGLEHVNSLQETMKEIYRICRHGAQVCIIAPYGQQSLDMANPLHKQVFNEHTPRFWTDSPTARLDPAEYQHPHAVNWGLATSDNSPVEMDFRCLRMEFFYFPEYRHLSQDEQRKARKKYLNVCDQIMYHLVVIKEPISEGDMKEMTKPMDYYEPPFIIIRKLQERSEFLEVEIGQLRELLAKREDDLNLFREKGKAITLEVDLFRHRKISRFVNRFFNKSDLQSDLLPTFLQLKDDSFIFNKNLKGFRLLPSKNLQRIPFVYYSLKLNRANLKGLLLAPIMDLPSRSGVLGIEIVSPANRVVAHSVVPASQINEGLPTRFDFSPIQDSDHGRFWLRVFVHDVDFPVRVLEWKKYSFFGLGPQQTRAFCGFLFENDE